MEITILYFASLKDRVGRKRETIRLPAGLRIEDLKQHLAERHSELGDALETALFSINREFAFPAEVLQEGDEVGIFPPVSGGASEPPTVLRLTQDPLDLNEMLDAIILPTTGAACAFTGVVRARTTRGEVRETEHLEYEAYPEMAQEKMRQVAAEIRDRWPEVEGILVVQRIGHLEPGTPTVMIACTAAHRDSGVFEAARYGIDRLKQIVPIWKKEVGPQGQSWIEGDYFPDERDQVR